MADLKTSCTACDTDITVFEDNAENLDVHFCAACLKASRGQA